MQASAGESPTAAAWRKFASDGCGLTAEAIFRRIAPPEAAPILLPTDASSLELLHVELHQLLPTSRANTSERMEAAQLLAKYVPRPFAADFSAEFLGQKLRDIQQWMAEAAMDRAVEMMRQSYWAPPLSIEAEFLSSAHVTVPVLAGEWLLAQGEAFGGYHETMWSVYGPLLSRLGSNGAALLAIGGDLQWQLPGAHINWCSSNPDAARMLVSCLTGIWRTHVLPDMAWVLRESEWDDWSNPLHPTFDAPPSWIAKIIHAAGPSAVPFIRPGLDDALAIIRMRSCAAFEYMGSANEETTKRITALLDDQDIWVRFFAAKALHAICPDRKDLHSRADELLRNY
jgi:hypothetical protein